MGKKTKHRPHSDDEDDESSGLNRAEADDDSDADARRASGRASENERPKFQNLIFIFGLVSTIITMVNSVLLGVAASDVFIMAPSHWMFLMVSEAGLILAVNILWLSIQDTAKPPKTRSKEHSVGEPKIRLYDERQITTFIKLSVVQLAGVALSLSKMYGYWSLYGDALKEHEFVNINDAILARADWRASAFTGSFVLVLSIITFFDFVAAEKKPFFTPAYRKWKAKQK